MNAIATASTRQTSRGAKPAAPAAPNKAISAFTDIASSLYAAALTDEAHKTSGDSDRLLRIAAGLADETSTYPDKCHDFKSIGFDVAALVKAAMLIPGDTHSPERIAFIDEAKAHLMLVTDCSTVLDPDMPRSAVVAPPPAQDAPDPELLMGEAISLNQLTSWVISARDLIGEIRLTAQINPSLRDLLTLHEVRYNSPEWLGSGADEGMAYMLMHQRNVIEALGRGAA